jgi:tetratricopeptide (TPR) repeat protein
MNVAQSDDLDAKMQRAADLIGEGEFYEKSGDLENCIAKYEEAAHLLTQANFPHDRIAEVYNHIKVLKEAMRQQSVQTLATKEKEGRSAESEAFALIDEGEAALKSGDPEVAISKYQEAIPKLEKAGYSTDHVKDKIKELTEKLRQTPGMKSSYKAVTPQPATFAQPAGAAKPAKPVKMPAKPMKPAGAHKPEITIPQEETKPVTVPDTTAEMKKLATFKETREKTDEMEKKAFELLDKAKAAMQDEQYLDALSTYGIIKNMLTNAGWDEDQLEPILSQENLVKEIMEAQEAAKSEPVAPVIEGEGGEEAVQSEAPRIVRQKLDLFMDQDTKMRKFKETQAKRQNLEGDAFSLMDEAQKMYKFGDVKDYPGAIENYQRAMKLLEKSGWTDQVAYVALEIERLKALNEKSIREKELAEEAEERKDEEIQERKQVETKKKQAMESDLKSVSSMLGQIKAKKEKQQEIDVEEGIKQKLLEEKKYKELVSRSTGKKSVESIKDMLFGDKDAKAAAELEQKKKQIEQDFISNTSKKYYDFKKAAKEQDTSAMESVEQVVDFVHDKSTASKQQAKPKAAIIDLKKKQEMEVKQQQEEKDKAVGDVLSMLGAMKKDKKDVKKAPKEPAVQDEELKKMFGDLKKKKQ